MTFKIGVLECDLCSHQSFCVFPTDVDRLECDQCGSMSGYTVVTEETAHTDLLRRLVIEVRIDSITNETDK